jgi:hypothetical protein
MCVRTVCEEGVGIGGAREVDWSIRDWFHSVHALLPGPDDISRPGEANKKSDLFWEKKAKKSLSLNICQQLKSGHFYKKKVTATYKMFRHL